MSELRYQVGFGNQHASEALAGALPRGQNSPQQVPFGLYAEQLSGTAFTAPRAENLRSWLYRLRPSAAHPTFAPLALAPGWASGPFDPQDASPNRLRWSALPQASASCTLIESVQTLAGNGAPHEQRGVVVHRYAANTSMFDEVFFNADGELLFVPEHGRVTLHTEFGILEVAPGQIALIPRGVRFRAVLPDGVARGYLGENYGAPFRLPELGPIGANGLANPRDFLAPVAAYEAEPRPTRLLQKYLGRFWQCELPASPLDVVAWHGNLTPYVYDLANFNTIGTVSFDHPDPSIFTVLTSPSGLPGTANCDFVIFPPRWMVAEHTFRPPWFHRNVMSELMGLVQGQYDAKAGGFEPGGASLHNMMSAHGPDHESYARAVAAELAPHKQQQTMAFMFESQLPLLPASAALRSPTLQADYDGCWGGLQRTQLP